MDKLIKFIFDIVIAILLMFGTVLIYFGLRTESVVRTMDSMITEEFLTRIKKDGHLHHREYEDYLHRLSFTGTIYELQFEHKYNIWEPEYRMRSLEEIMEAQKAAYTGKNIYHYREVTTSRPAVTDPIDNSGLTMNTETNESVLAAAVNTPSTGHVHTDACYAGHVHKGDKTFTHSHAHTSACKRYLWCAGANIKCNSCGYEGYWMIAIYDQYGNNIGQVFVPDGKCPSCNKPAIVTAGINKYTYSCGYNVFTTDQMNADVIPNGSVRSYPGCTSPQNTNSATYTSGCYVYHKSRSWRDMLEYFPWTGEIMNAGTVFNNILDTNAAGMCDVPQWYYKGVVYMEGPISGTTWISLSYSAVNVNGSARYNYGGFNYYYNDGIWGYKSEWPSGITGYEANRVFNLSSSTGQYTGRSWSTSQDYKYEYGMSGDVKLCTFDHSRGVNQWVLACEQEENATLLCPDKIVSITPTHPLQSVYTQEPLITTVRATYVDGSKKTVKATAAFSTGTPASNKIVTLSYTDSLGNTKTCTITVNVIPRSKTCTNGHLYNLNPNGSDPGCPFCNAYVAIIRIINPPASTFTITIGTSLKDNGLTLLVTYMDGRTETIMDGYVDNLDRQYLGTKMVTIGYKGVTTQILVTTICAKITCDVCGFLYDLYPDGTNPGCPRCISKIPVFTGNVLRYDAEEYTDEILERMYENGSYDLSMDNTFRVRLKNKSPNLARSILQKIYPSLPEEWLSLKFSENIKAK